MTVDEFKAWIGKNKVLWVIPVAAFLIGAVLTGATMLEGLVKAKDFVVGLVFGHDMAMPEKWVKYDVLDCCTVDYPIGWVVTTGQTTADPIHAFINPPKPSPASDYGVEIAFHLGDNVDKAWFDKVVPEAEKPDPAFRDTAKILRPAGREFVYGFKAWVSEAGFWHRQDPVVGWGVVSEQQTNLYCDLNDDEKTQQPLPILTRIGRTHTDRILAINYSQVWGSDWARYDDLFWKYVSCGAPTNQFDHVRQFCDEFFSRLAVGTLFCEDHTR